MQATSKRILKDMCRIMGHECVPMTHVCDRCGWVPIYGVNVEERRAIDGTIHYSNLRRPGEGYRVQHRTVVFDQPIPAGINVKIHIGHADIGSWSIQQFVGDGVRKGFRVEP